MAISGCTALNNISGSAAHLKITENHTNQLKIERLECIFENTKYNYVYYFNEVKRRLLMIMIKILPCNYKINNNQQYTQCKIISNNNFNAFLKHKIKSK